MIHILYYDLRLSLRSTGGPGSALCVFLLALVIFPLLVGPELDLLTRVGPGLIWLMACLASLLYAPTLLQEDREDGTLAQLLLVPITPLTLTVTKILSHLLLVGCPVTLLSLLSAPFYGLSFATAFTLMTTLLIALPAISSLCILGTFLCEGAQGSTLLLIFLILPLTIPLLLFGLSSVDSVSLGLPVKAHLLLLCGTSIIVTFFALLASRYLLESYDTL